MELIERTAGGVRWRLLPAWLEGLDTPERLFGAGGLRLAEWLEGGSARPVKQGPVRSVYRVTLPGCDFHLKHDHPDRRGGLRALLGPGKARGEFERLLEVARRGVPAPEPLAYGEGGPRGSFVATRTLTDAQPLGAFLTAAGGGLDAAVRQAVAHELGNFLAGMHRAGVRHRDLHPDNLLLRWGPAGRPLLALIDLDAVSLGAPLSWREARDNLVMLNRWFALRCARADRLRFWRAYAAAPPPPGKNRGGRSRTEEGRGGDAPRDLERRTLESNLRFWRKLDRRPLTANRYFRRLRGAGYAGHAVADLDEAALAPLLADPDGPFADPTRKEHKASRSSAVVELALPLAGELRRVVLKRFAVTAWSDPWTALLRQPPAVRSFALGHALRVRGLPTPRPLAVWHRVRHGLAREGYLLVEQVPDATDLGRFVARLLAEPEGGGRARLRALIDQVARLVRDLHGRRLSHRDLKAGNLLVSPQGWEMAAKGLRERAGRGDWVWFIDLVGVRRHGALGPRRKVRDLARLNCSFLAGGVTLTDRLRFLRAYLGWGLGGKYGWKVWWKAVARSTRAKERRNLRKGRPLG